VVTSLAEIRHAFDEFHSINLRLCTFPGWKPESGIARSDYAHDIIHQTGLDENP
jgi:hypothetical protein